MDRIPDQLGYLVLTMDGAVIASGGDLENDERIADIIAKSITTSKSLYVPEEQYHKMSIIYHQYHYAICVSNKKIHVSKIKHDPRGNTLENDEIRVLEDSS